MDVAMVLIWFLAAVAFVGGVGFMKGRLIGMYIGILALLFIVFAVGAALHFVGANDYLWTLYTVQQPALIAIPSFWLIGGFVGALTG